MHKRLSNVSRSNSQSKAYTRVQPITEKIYRERCKVLQTVFIAFPRNAIDSDFTVDITYFMKSIGLAYDINITLLWHSRGR